MFQKKQDGPSQPAKKTPPKKKKPATKAERNQQVIQSAIMGPGFQSQC